MKKVLGILIITALIMTSIGSITVSASESEDYGWELVEIVDLDNKEAFEDYNEGYKDNYNIEGSYGRNNFSIKWTYIGQTDTYSDPDKINGESITFDASFSKPPEQIKPGDEISIKVSLSAGSNSLSYYSPSASVRGQIGKNNSGWSDYINSDKKASFKTDVKNNYANFNEDILATAPQGKEGDTLELRFHLYSTQKLETRYLYEYKKLNGNPVEVEDETTQVIQNEEDESKVSNERKLEKVPEGYKDSGVRFSDIYGEVLIRRHDDPLGWDGVDLNTVICVGDHIKTSYDSGAVVSLPDMTTFHLVEESHIIMDTESEEKNKLALLAGKIITNVKKMIKDGSMNIEMSQAVAGIKGTTFVLEEDGNTSTLKVFEGAVEFTPYGEEPIIVSGEERVSVTDGIPSQVEKFSISQELNSWDKDIQEEYVKILEEKGVTFEDSKSDTEEVDYNFEEKIDEYEEHVQKQSIFKYLVGAVLIGGVIGAFFLFKKIK
ncbi:MAG TPA: hypothetical protein DHM42_11320 [Clostridiales bacterium]|nr:hypothetical protein [Clostridiales bacterium]